MKNTLGEMIQGGLSKVTRDFTRAKMQAHGRQEKRISQWQIDRWANQDTEKQLKAAAYEVLPQAYNLVSDNGRFPANKRQIFYAVPIGDGCDWWQDLEKFANIYSRRSG
jgi:hypothetical protein